MAQVTIVVGNNELLLEQLPAFPVDVKLAELAFERSTPKVMEIPGPLELVLEQGIPGGIGPKGDDGASAELVEEGFIPTAAQTEFVLSVAARDQWARVFVNGVAYEADDYTILGTALTWTGPFALETTDRLWVQYLVDGDETGPIGASIYMPEGW